MIWVLDFPLSTPLPPIHPTTHLLNSSGSQISCHSFFDSLILSFTCLSTLQSLFLLSSSQTFKLFIAPKHKWHTLHYSPSFLSKFSYPYFIPIPIPSPFSAHNSLSLLLYLFCSHSNLCSLLDDPFQLLNSSHFLLDNFAWIFERQKRDLQRVKWEVTDRSWWEMSTLFAIVSLSVHFIAGKFSLVWILNNSHLTDVWTGSQLK